MYNNFSIEAANKNIPREKLAIYEYCVANNINFHHCQKFPEEDNIPIGSIDFCESLDIIKNTPKDFYPKQLANYLHRKIVYSNFTELTEYFGPAKFIKRAEEWKHEMAPKLLLSGDWIQPGKYWMSDPVDFVQEWRYYLCSGKVITTGWYAGNNDDEPAPLLDYDFGGLSGAADFGRLSTGEIALVEFHAPFACGWYGERSDNLKYSQWQYEAFNQYFNRKIE